MHSSPSALTARVTMLEDSLKDEEKMYHVYFDSIKEKTRQVE